ncbi:MAG: HlyD family efflux transporter periplasmic adaptor subunit [Thermodesulfobacteriota bacterium]|nr:HlyD family efflux transporter periplasmic adaptor subunit [Thermodesulfobacteriota bacterium]
MNGVMKGTLIGLISLLTPVLVPVPFWASDEAEKSWVEGGIFAARPAARQVTLIGYTRARHVMDIVSEESDRCVKVAADVGDTIGEGGIFCVLDTTFMDLSIEKNRVDQERVENRITYEIKEVRRFEELVGRESAAQSKLDELQNRVDQSRFELETLKTEEAHLKERRERHIIRVPTGWTITERTVEPGQWVQAGALLGKAGDFRKLLVPFSLSPEEYNAVRRLRGPAKLRFPDEGQEGTLLEAELERISPAFDPETRKISVDLSVQEGLSHMRGGLRAVLVLEVPDGSGTVLVPTSALSERYEALWLTREDGEQVRVVLLDHGPQNTSRVRSAEVKPGERFKVRPEP